MQIVFFAVAAFFELVGCYLVWLAQKPAQFWLWAPAVLCLALFSWILTLTGTAAAGRTFAVYGGIYIAASIAFMMSIEQVRPTSSDLLGTAICLVGAAIIYFAPRSA